jgi:hypothetical protein
MLAAQAAFATILAITAGCETETPRSEVKPPEERSSREGKSAMRGSPLQQAIDRGTKPDGDLVEELDKLGNYPVRTRKDAQAICEALRRLPERPSDGKTFSSPLHALTGLFQEVDGPDAPALPASVHR